MEDSCYLLSGRERHPTSDTPSLPQFEIRHTDSDAPIAKIRARSIEDAVRTHFELNDETSVSIESGPDFGALEGWRSVAIDGRTAGQIREFHRMKFRRA